MGKSASSSKKTKRSKDSSKLRSVNEKKKTKRSKSKKIHRIKEYSDESESRSGSDSSLYSSSEDDYRRQKRRSKVSKKRSRKRYSSSESDDDDDNARLLKKKKRSKRKDEHVGSKKKKKKKISSRKRRKSRDWSSTGDSQSSDDGGESDGKRRIRDREKLGKVVKATRRRSKDRSEEECWQVEDEVMTEKNPRRLKSIIVVSCSYDKDERKEDSGDRELGYSEESDSDNGGETVGYDEFGEDNKSETSKALKDDDLEAILKKRALENLKRFRGIIASKEVSSAADGEGRQIESENNEDGLMEQKKLDVPADRTVASQQSGDRVSSGIIPCSSKRKLIRPVLGQESSLKLASGKETAGCEDAEAESIINGGTIDKDCPESSLALATKNRDENREPTKASSTLNAQSSSLDTLGETRGESQSEQKTSDESKDESQYEQKTMTVMRGGEMVQVSYKVYIPKKTSALGRRKLQR